MKIKTAEAIGPALDWLVAKALYGARLVHYRTWLETVNEHWKGRDCSFAPTGEFRILSEDFDGVTTRFVKPYSTDWAQGGPIIEREDISVIRLDNVCIPDDRGFWQNKYRPAWGAVIGDRHSATESYSPQGDCWGLSYSVDENAITGPTPLIAAMRCHVKSKLGDEVEVPDELI